MANAVACQHTLRPSLTPWRRAVVKDTWKMVEDQVGLLATGIEVFKKLFTICPAALELFPFSHVPLEDLPENELFCSHALQVAEAISMAVSSMDDLRGLGLVLKDLGAAHSSRGLKDMHFDYVELALIDVVEEELGDKFTPEVKEAYIAFYGMVAKHMKNGLNLAFLINKPNQ